MAGGLQKKKRGSTDLGKKQPKKLPSGAQASGYKKKRLSK